MDQLFPQHWLYQVHTKTLLSTTTTAHRAKKSHRSGRPTGLVGHGFCKNNSAMKSRQMPRMGVPSPTRKPISLSEYEKYVCNPTHEKHFDLRDVSCWKHYAILTRADENQQLWNKPNFSYSNNNSSLVQAMVQGTVTCIFVNSLCNSTSTYSCVSYFFPPDVFFHWTLCIFQMNACFALPATCDFLEGR